MESTVLQIRKTHTYVGDYAHLDEWDDIGAVRLIAREVVREPGDHEDGGSVQFMVRVSSDQPAERIREALSDTFSHHGCAHDYDCCGCASHTVGNIQHEGGTIWSFVRSTSYNF